MPLFSKMTLDEAFELLLNRKIIASEFKQASRRIHKLKETDWRIWFGRFLLSVRSDAENDRFTDAYMCLSEAERLLDEKKDSKEYEKFNSLIDNESLFLVFKFYYEATGISVLALFLARFYQNGWGVKADVSKACEYAKVAVNMRETEPAYLMAQNLLNSLLLQVANTNE